MSSPFIQRLFAGGRLLRPLTGQVHDPVRSSWGALGHLPNMDALTLFGLGLEPMLTTSELAERYGYGSRATAGSTSPPRRSPCTGTRFETAST